MASAWADELSVGPISPAPPPGSEKQLDGQNAKLEDSKRPFSLGRRSSCPNDCQNTKRYTDLISNTDGVSGPKQDLIGSFDLVSQFNLHRREELFSIISRMNSDHWETSGTVKQDGFGRYFYSFFSLLPSLSNLSTRSSIVTCPALVIRGYSSPDVVVKPFSFSESLPPLK